MTPAGRYIVGYATRDGNTHTFRRYHRLSVALRIEDMLRAKYGRSIAAYTYDNENPERGMLSELNLEENGGPL